MARQKNRQEKERLHPRNRNKGRYDLYALIKVTPELVNYVRPNKYGEDSVDFSNVIAVKLLNKALLKHYYGIENWDFPDENLCPPIPGRADYIHYIADLLCQENYGTIPNGNHITCIDIGIGANCIYPIIGVTEYNWNFIGSDADPKSIASARHIVDSNLILKDKVECRLQNNPKHIFRGVITKDDKIDVVICNPPFHSSKLKAQKSTHRKVKNLSGKKVKNVERNFAGITDELVYPGGEYQFIHNMIQESKAYSKQCFWFSTLVSKQSHLKRIYNALETIDARKVKTIPMGTGNKSTRIVAWSYFSKDEKKEWTRSRWSS